MKVYKIVIETDLTRLEDRVNNAIKENWHPVQGITVFTIKNEIRFAKELVYVPKASRRNVLVPEKV